MLTTELLAAALVLTADGCQSGRPFVRVSIEWRARAVPETLGSIVREEVEAIWRRLGVTVQWTERPGAGTVHVTVTDEFGRRPRGAALPKLGWIEFWGERPSSLLRVSAAAAVVTAFEARTTERLSSGQPLSAVQFTAARLVGRAIAHELGHYLLRSRAHTPAGLMRPVFSAHEGTVPLLDRYRLERRQMDALHAPGGFADRRCGG